MTRRVGETIEVQAAAAPDGEGEGGQPRVFLWRGRVYRVTSVVDHWQERSAWWRATAEGVPLDVAGAPRQVWRVAAQAGRSGAEGIYDLLLDPCAASTASTASTVSTAPAAPVWSLVRTQD